MRHTACLGTGLLLLGSVLATAQAGERVHPQAHATPSGASRVPHPGLYSPRARRLVQSYLRLRLLELREAELDRLRLIIERRLGVRPLPGETPRPDAW